MKSVDEKLTIYLLGWKGQAKLKYISLDLGTHSLSIAAAQKNVSLTSVATFAAEIYYYYYEFFIYSW